MKNIIFSTDSQKMRKIANKCNINTPWLRPKKISKDNSTSFDASLHAIDWYEKNYSKVDSILLLQPTSPFRSFLDYKKALKKFKKNPNLPLISIKKISLTSDKFLEKDDKYIKSIDKTLSKNIYIPNGSFFLIKKDILIKNRSFISKKMNYILIKDNLKNIDIDEPNDYKLAKLLSSNKL